MEWFGLKCRCLNPLSGRPVIVFIVPLSGITQVITENYPQNRSPEELNKKGFEILTKLQLTKSVPAVGVMFVKKQKGVISIDPIVWVRDIKTLFFETACASGTAAVGLVEAMKLARSQNRSEICALFSICQPSGNFLKVFIKLKNGIPDYAEIGGPVKIIKKQVIDIY